MVTATDTLSDDDLRQAVYKALPNLEETLMPTLAQQWYEQGVQKGIEQGIQKGIEQGIQKGIENGEAIGERQGQAVLLTRLLERRFGPLPETCRQRIQAADTDTLLQWGDALLSTASLEEIFGEGFSQAKTPDP